MADDQTATEYKALLDGIDHWSTVDLIHRLTGVPADQVRTVLEALRHEDVGTEVCRLADVEQFMLKIDTRVFNERQKFAQRAVEVIGECKPEYGKGPNYTSIYEQAIEDAKDRIEDRFK